LTLSYGSRLASRVRFLTWGTLRPGGSAQRTATYKYSRSYANLASVAYSLAVLPAALSSLSGWSPCQQASSNLPSRNGFSLVNRQNASRLGGGPLRLRSQISAAAASLQAPLGPWARYLAYQSWALGTSPSCRWAALSGN